jgi:hypothetical protein
VSHRKKKPYKGQPGNGRYGGKRFSNPEQAAKEAARERNVGLSKDDEAARWLAENDPEQTTSHKPNNQR